jgi:hypothetical protein
MMTFSPEKRTKATLKKPSTSIKWNACRIPLFSFLYVPTGLCEVPVQQLTYHNQYGTKVSVGFPAFLVSQPSSSYLQKQPWLPFFLSVFLDLFYAHLSTNIHIYKYKYIPQAFCRMLFTIMPLQPFLIGTCRVLSFFISCRVVFH